MNAYQVFILHSQVTGFVKHSFFSTKASAMRQASSLHKDGYPVRVMQRGAVVFESV